MMNRKAKLEKALAFDEFAGMKNDYVEGRQFENRRLTSLHAALIEAISELEFALRYLNDENDCGRYCDLSIDWHTPECSMETSFTEALSKIDNVLKSVERSET